MQPTPERALSRRAILLGAAGVAGMGLLAACGSTSSNATGDANGTDIALTPVDGRSSLQAIFDAANPFVVTGSPQRMAFGIVGPDGATIKDVPASLEFRISLNGQDVGAPITVAGHSDGVPIGYYPLRTTFQQPGDYRVAVTLDGASSTQDVTVGDGASSSLVPRGGKMRPVETPTVADHRGVEPICTQPSGTCPFHTQTVTQALAAGKPTALLVSTPEFCQIGVCGPVLTLLEEAAARYPTIQFIHAEVYTNAEAVKDAQQATLAPVIDAYGLTYEPALFVADAGGTVIERLDNVFDRGELNEALTTVA